MPRDPEQVVLEVSRATEFLRRIADDGHGRGLLEFTDHMTQAINSFGRSELYARRAENRDELDIQPRRAESYAASGMTTTVRDSDRWATPVDHLGGSEKTWLGTRRRGLETISSIVSAGTCGRAWPIRILSHLTLEGSIRLPTSVLTLSVGKVLRACPITSNKV